MFKVHFSVSGKINVKQVKLSTLVGGTAGQFEIQVQTETCFIHVIIFYLIASGTGLFTNSVYAGQLATQLIQDTSNTVIWWSASNLDSKFRKRLLNQFYSIRGGMTD